MKTLSVSIPLGDVEPVICSVDQPMGHRAGEMLAEEFARLTELLVKQQDALPAWAGMPGSPMSREDCLQHEMQLCLRSIQRLAATPPDRCVS